MLNSRFSNHSISSCAEIENEMSKKPQNSWYSSEHACIPSLLIVPYPSVSVLWLNYYPGFCSCCFKSLYNVVISSSCSLSASKRKFYWELIKFSKIISSSSGESLWSWFNLLGMWYFSCSFIWTSLVAAVISSDSGLFHLMRGSVCDCCHSVSCHSIFRTFFANFSCWSALKIDPVVRSDLKIMGLWVVCVGLFDTLY